MTQAMPVTNPPLVCWNCHERAQGTHFCPSCGKLQQAAGTTDFFALFGMPRKLWIEMNALEQRFLQLSWKLHPDNFVNATETERELSLKRSSELNDAYRVLRDPVARVEYLLGLEKMRKEGEHKQQAPPELLEEVFELNESLDELREAKSSGSDLAALKSRLEAAEKSFGENLGEVDAQLQEAARTWDAGIDANADDAARKKIMARLNELLNRRSYIRNLVVNVAKELGEV
ncbi:MAG TPA: Fe-S protein assembly co-chaperone HscB [Candidatus Acidoferrum sp.]|jgi:molecular chaperone HscB|nr:Fe-S protein assembly co-chaperone HscB [Candidatus Acidoferrum sp.]